MAMKMNTDGCNPHGGIPTPSLETIARVEKNAKQIMARIAKRDRAYKKELKKQVLVALKKARKNVGKLKQVPPLYTELPEPKR
jgi:hypothetical protein